MPSLRGNGWNERTQNTRKIRSITEATTESWTRSRYQEIAENGPRDDGLIHFCEGRTSRTVSGHSLQHNNFVAYQLVVRNGDGRACPFVVRSITVGNMFVPQLFADVDVTLHIALERSVVESADSFTNESWQERYFRGGFMLSNFTPRTSEPAKSVS